MGAFLSLKKSTNVLASACFYWCCIMYSLCKYDYIYTFINNFKTLSRCNALCVLFCVSKLDTLNYCLFVLCVPLNITPIVLCKTNLSRTICGTNTITLEQILCPGMILYHGIVMDITVYRYAILACFYHSINSASHCRCPSVCPLV